MPFASYQNKAFVTVDNYLTSALLYVADGRNYTASSLADSHFKENIIKFMILRKYSGMSYITFHCKTPRLLQVK